MEQDEIQLAIAWKAGDNRAFEQLYQQYVKKIFDYVWYRTFNKTLAEDLTSTVFLKAFDNIASFDPARGSFKSWVYRIAANSLIDHYRTVKTTDSIEAAASVASSSNPTHDTDLSLLSDYVKDLLTKLPSEARDLIVMRLWDDLSYKEIAELTGKTEASLKMQFSRLMEKLRSDQSINKF